MFDIGFQELVLVAIVTLLVLGPERLPQALRTLGLWMGRMRRSFNAVRNEIEREIGMDEIRRQLHNEAVMDELRRIEQGVRSTGAAPASASTSALEAASERSAPAAVAAATDPEVATATTPESAAGGTRIPGQRSDA